MEIEIKVGDRFEVSKDASRFVYNVRGRTITILSIDGQLINYGIGGLNMGSCVRAEFIERIEKQICWRVGSATSKAPLPREDSDRTRHMRFFFGCRPSDPSRLPPPPKPVLGGWPDLDD